MSKPLVAVLIKQRNKHGLRGLARMLNVSTSIIRHWIKHGKVPNPEHIVLLNFYLDIPFTTICPVLFNKKVHELVAKELKEDDS